MEKEKTEPMPATGPTIRDVNEHWKVAGPELAADIGSKRDLQVEGLLDSTIGVFSFVIEGHHKKRTKNLQLAGRLEPLVILGFEVLRGAHSAQLAGSLATAALCSRTEFEACVTLKYITNSDSDKRADLFDRFQYAERLKQHQEGLRPLEPADLQRPSALCPEWCDKNGTVPLNSKWHARKKFSFKDMAAEVGELSSYQTLYSLGSLFTHGSAVIKNLYRQGKDLFAVADPKHVRVQSIVTMTLALALLQTYGEFFGIPLPADCFAVLRRQIDSAAVGK